MLKRMGLSLVVIALAALVSPRIAAAGGRLFPDTIALPDGFQPEGVAVGFGATIYAGSIPTGAIYAASLATGRGAILVPAQAGRAAIGLSFDARSNVLYVAGGPTGAAYAYDARTGATLAVYQLTTATSTFINDQIITRDAVYFTDSSRAVLYRVPLGHSARPSPTARVTEIPLTGEWQQIENAFNANGIVASEDGRWLVVVHSQLGTLFRVDPRTGDARAIDLGGANVNFGDGMELRGDRLAVVQNQLNTVITIDLDRRFLSGEVVRSVTDDRFDVPTTIDSFLGVPYVVNARFGTPATPETTYTIEKVR